MSVRPSAAGPGSDREPAPGTSAYPDDRRVPWAGPGSVRGRRHREACLVLAAEPQPRAPLRGFHQRPGLLHPAAHRFLVALRGAAGRDLRAEAVPVQRLRDRRQGRARVQAASDQGLNPRQRPDPVRQAVRHRPSRLRARSAVTTTALPRSRRPRLRPAESRFLTVWFAQPWPQRRPAWTVRQGTGRRRPAAPVSVSCSRQAWVGSASVPRAASTAGQMAHLGVCPRTVSRKVIGVWPVRWWKYLLKWVALEKPRRSAIRAAL